jgi:hypothetical protein
MTEKSNGTIRVSREEAARIAREWATPENLARLDAMTEADIARQIADDPDVAPELTDEWFENARLVMPLKGRRRVA